MRRRLLVLLATAIVSTALLDEHAELLITVKAELEKGPVNQATLRDLEEAVVEEPKEVDLMAALGYALLSAGDTALAVTHLTNALNLGKKQKRKDSPIHLHATIIQTLMRLDRYQDAASIYENHGHEISAAVHQHLALRLSQAARTEADFATAMLHAAKAMELAPSEPSSHLAQAFSRVGSDQEGAVVAFRRAFRLRAGDAESAADSAFPNAWPQALEAAAWHTFGVILASNPINPLKNERLDEARQAFEKAVQLVPGSTRFEHSLKEVITSQGQRREALGAAAEPTAAKPPVVRMRMPDEL